jgi:hypothetical protein
MEMLMTLGGMGMAHSAPLMLTWLWKKEFFLKWKMYFVPEHPSSSISCVFAQYFTMGISHSATYTKPRGIRQQISSRNYCVFTSLVRLLQEA